MTKKKTNRFPLVGLLLFITLILFSACTVKAAATADYDGAVEKILAALDDYEQTVEIDEFNIPATYSSVTTMQERIEFDTPQYVQFGGLGSYYYTTVNSEKIIQKVTIVYYTDSAAETTKVREAYEEKMEALLSQADADWTDFEKILYANECLSIGCDYGSSQGNYCYNAYGPIVLGEAVCAGYSLAFKDLMNRLGVDCCVVTSLKANHAWDAVKLGSYWYYVDVTFNNPDPVGYAEGSAKHDHLLLSASQLLSDSQHGEKSEWSYRSSVEVGDDSDTTFDSYFWDDVSLPFYYYDGYWYGLIPQEDENATYVTINGITVLVGDWRNDYALIRYKTSNAGLTAQKTIAALPKDSYDEDELAEWVSSSFYSVSYTGNYTGFASCGKYFYCSDPHSIWCIDVTTGSTTTILELSSSDKALGYIDGITVDGDGLLTYDFLTGYEGSRVYEARTIRVHTHTLTTKTTSAATFVSTGTKVQTCSDCGQVRTLTTAKVTCKKGKSYTVGNYTYKITSAKTDGSGTVAFTGLAKSVTAVKVAKTVKILGASFKVTQIAEGALKKQTKITSVSVGANVKKIGKNAFSGCTKLATVTGCSAVTSIGESAFSGCSKLASVSGCAAVTSIGSKAFYKCAKLKYIGSKKSRITLAKIKTIGASAFQGCTTFTYVNLSSTALTSIGDKAFYGCTKLKTFISSSSKLKSVGAKAFYGDKKLASVTFRTSKLTSSNVGSSAFKGISSSCTFKVPSKKVSAYKKIFKAKGAGSRIKVKKNS
ncbi:MAG: leucine-rich repeat protein [Lachnospiraceae bacterium]|nr:leucine-rich repeat protein [Lachnospiraceae bacterium]